jgi:hypothetical protein
MNEPQLGKLIEGEAARDAVHIAIAPVVAAETLVPGQDIGLDSKTGMAGGYAAPSIGIVDPFLKFSVDRGQSFYMFLYPRTITSLRHDWTHPAFNTPDDKTYSERWLREYAVKFNSYSKTPEDAFNRLIDDLRTGSLNCYGSDTNHLSEIDNADLLKEHGERYLGIKIDWDQFSFSCSC